MLAALFALAFTLFAVAQSIAVAVVSALQQHLVDENTGGSGFDFQIAGAGFDLYAFVQAALTLVLVVGFFVLVWKLTRRELRECPPCRSDVPVEAAVCRYCTADLPEPASS